MTSTPTAPSDTAVDVPAAGRYRPGPARSLVTFGIRHLSDLGVASGTVAATGGEITIGTQPTRPP